MTILYAYKQEKRIEVPLFFRPRSVRFPQPGTGLY